MPQARWRRLHSRSRRTASGTRPWASRSRREAVEQEGEAEHLGPVALEAGQRQPVLRLLDLAALEQRVDQRRDHPRQRDPVVAERQLQLATQAISSRRSASASATRPIRSRTIARSATARRSCSSSPAARAESATPVQLGVGLLEPARPPSARPGRRRATSRWPSGERVLGVRRAVRGRRSAGDLDPRADGGGAGRSRAAIASRPPRRRAPARGRARRPSPAQVLAQLGASCPRSRSRTVGRVGEVALGEQRAAELERDLPALGSGRRARAPRAARAARPGPRAAISARASSRSSADELRRAASPPRRRGAGTPPPRPARRAPRRRGRRRAAPRPPRRRGRGRRPSRWAATCSGAGDAAARPRACSSARSAAGIAA